MGKHEKILRNWDANFSPKLEVLSIKVITDNNTDPIKIESNLSTIEKCTDSITNNKQIKFIPFWLLKYLGLLLTLLASVIFSICVLLVKILSNPSYGFNSFSSSFWRYFGVTLPSIPLILFVERSRKNRNLDSVTETIWPPTSATPNGESREKLWTFIGLLIRGFLSGCSVILRYFALEYLTLGDTAVITYATPVLVTVMAHFILNEKCGIISVLIALLTFCGVLIIMRPPFLTGEDTFDTNLLIGTSLAIAALVSASLLVVVTRKIRKVHFALMTLVVGIVGVAQALSLTQIFGRLSIPTTWPTISMVLSLMVLSFIGQMAIILALKMEEAGPVALVRSCDVIFAFIFQFAFLGIVPDWISGLGATIVLSCVLMTGIRKWLSSLPEDSPQRRSNRQVQLSVFEY